MKRPTKTELLKARVVGDLHTWYEHEAATQGLDLADLVRRALSEFRNRIQEQRRTA